MIKKILFTAIFSALSLFADFNPAIYKTTLDKVTGNSAKVKDRDIAVGSSGIVLHSFDGEHKTIIARAEVISKESGNLSVSFSKFDRLVQKALPDYKIKPSKGDTLILNYLYNRILPITPNEESFKEFKEKFSSFDIVHPDIFASNLFIEKEPLPSKRDFQANCKKNDYALLFFSIDKLGYFVDCSTFKVLDTITLSSDVNPTMKPFYSRIPKIKSSLGAIIGEKDIGDYNLYYKKMLGLK